LQDLAATYNKCLGQSVSVVRLIREIFHIWLVAGPEKHLHNITHHMIVTHSGNCACGRETRDHMMLLNDVRLQQLLG